MSYSVGDGMVTLALVGGILGYLYLKHQARLKRIEVIHQERLAAMDKGIPLPEFPLEPVRDPKKDADVLPILGIVLSTISVGTMVVLFLTLSAESRNFWITPLPIMFMGVGLIGFHFLKSNPRR